MTREPASLPGSVTPSVTRYPFIRVTVTRNAHPDVEALDVIMPEAYRRLAQWQAVLAEESVQARRMLRTLLRGRLVFTPDLERRACEFVGEGDLSAVFRGLIDLPKALASPTGFDPILKREYFVDIAAA